MNSKQIEDRMREINAALATRNGGSLIGSYHLATPPEKQEIEELNMREMIITIYCYGGKRQLVESMKGQWDRYLLDYVERVGEERAREIVCEQTDYMDEHARIIHNVVTDCDGVSYNSIEWS